MLMIMITIIIIIILKFRLFRERSRIKTLVLVEGRYQDSSTDDRISKFGHDRCFACSVSRWMDHHRLYLLLNLLDLPLLMPIVLSYVISVTLPIFSVCFLGKCICSLFVYLFILQFYLLGVTQSLLFR